MLGQGLNKSQGPIRTDRWDKTVNDQRPELKPRPLGAYWLRAHHTYRPHYYFFKPAKSNYVQVFLMPS